MSTEEIVTYNERIVICETDTHTLTLAWLILAPLLSNRTSRPRGWRVGGRGGRERVKLSGSNIILGEVILSAG